MPVWLTDIARDYFWPETEYVVRVLVAVVLGGLIGFERELHDKPAGLRTIMLICLGACIFTIASELVGGPDWNSTRIAAQIVTGIGFLGAGAIIRDRQDVVGLTTAATIWTVAAIGMAAGFGLLALATFGTIVILIALLVFDFLEHWVGRRRDIQEYRFVAPKANDTFDRVGGLFKRARLGIRKRDYYEEGASLVFDITAMGSKKDHERLRAELARSEDYTLRPP
jgi:putative Mg2+ transporter-C (MgtC) family protein